MILPYDLSGADGATYYWDPNGGSSGNGGTGPADAKDTWTNVVALASEGDTIICGVWGATAQHVTTDANDIVDMNLEGLKLICAHPSHVVLGGNASQASATVVMSAVGCYLFGFEIQSQNSQYCINPTASDCIIENCYCDDSASASIFVSAAADRLRVRDVRSNSAAGAAVFLADGAEHCEIRDLVSRDDASGVDVNGSSCVGTIIRDCVFQGTTGDAIEDDGDRTTVINCAFVDCTVRIDDNGTAFTQYGGLLSSDGYAIDTVMSQFFRRNAL